MREFEAKILIKFYTITAFIFYKEKTVTFFKNRKENINGEFINHVYKLCVQIRSNFFLSKTISIILNSFEYQFERGARIAQSSIELGFVHHNHLELF